MNIINIIDRIDKVNFGIWNAALSTSKILKKNFNVDSFAIFPKIDDMPDVKKLYNAQPFALENADIEHFNKILNNFSPNDSIIVSHGSWRFPTKMAYQAAKNGFKWVYTPHGMLEPWGLNHKKLKKIVYFNLFEKKYARKANFIRAVSSTEKKNLEKNFKNVILIPNGAEFISCNLNNQTPCTILFLGRLNDKKNVYELLKAWCNSKIFNNKNYLLKIIGPDDGSYIKLKQLYEQLPEEKNVFLSNIPIYGNEKQNALLNSDYFILPSKSEGFPTSIIEAGMSGCIPIYTDGCNFPELKQNNLGIHTNCDYESLKNLFDNFETSTQNNKEKHFNFFKTNYSIEKIAEMQINLYNQIIPSSEKL